MGNLCGGASKSKFDVDPKLAIKKNLLKNLDP